MKSHRKQTHLELDHLRPLSESRTSSLLHIGSALAALSLAACSTEEIDRAHFKLSSTATPDQPAPFALSIVEDADSFEEGQQLMASGQLPTYSLKVDGLWAVEQVSDTESWQVSIQGGSVGGMHWMSAGPHVFELVDENGQTALQTATYDVEAGQTNHLVVFGHREALENRFFADTLDIPVGKQTFTVINLLRSGQSVEVLQCDDASTTANCTVVAGPAAYGELARGQTDAPAPAASSVTNPSNLFYRIVPTTDVPAPTLFQLRRDAIVIGSTFPNGLPIYTAAPVFVMPSGAPAREAF
jgi:hypothetical protein